MDNYLFESIAVFERKKEIKQKGRKFLQKRKMFGLKKKKKILGQRGHGIACTACTSHSPPLPRNSNPEKKVSPK